MECTVLLRCPLSKKKKTLLQETRDVGLIPGSGRSTEGGHGNPLQYSCLENPMDRGACGLQSIVLEESEATEVTQHAQCKRKKVQVKL